MLQMVMDSLRFWVQEMHVDGFRFDLATTLAREAHGYDSGAGFLDSILQDPVLSRVKMIAEPWDIGLGGYQLAVFRQAGPNGTTASATRPVASGAARPRDRRTRGAADSSDIYQHNGRRPWSSINFITAHDGFTLHDLVSYERKHNKPMERTTGTVRTTIFLGTAARRDQQTIRKSTRCANGKRNFLATLLLAQGTPMITAGDEFGRTQGGNNNAYCQDNEISWVHWMEQSEDDAALAASFRNFRSAAEASGLSSQQVPYRQACRGLRTEGRDVARSGRA